MSNTDKHITIIVGPNEKVFVMELQRFVVANEEGLVKLNMTELTTVVENKANTIQRFEQELQTLLSEDQQYALFEYLGGANTLTNTALAARLDMSKEDAKQLIQLALRCGVLVQGWNNSWKIINKVVKDRFTERARNRFTQERQNAPETFEERKTRLQKEGFDLSNGGEGSEVNSRVSSEKLSVEVINEDKIYSGATHAKKIEKEAYDRQVAKDKAEALTHMNTQGVTRSTCVQDMSVEVPKKLQVPAKKIPFPVKAIRKK